MKPSSSLRISGSGLSPWAPPALLAVLFCVLAGFSWRKWPDVLIDFGRELYLPWQLACGKVLYRDLAHLFGPLSQYYHSWLFRAFGVSYTAIFVSNLVLLALFVCALYAFLARFASRAAAFAGCVAVIVFCGFPHYNIGSFNFVSPYAQESTHGLVLGFAMVALLSLSVVRRRAACVAAAGFVLGLVSLTKVEPFLAASATAVLYFVLGGRRAGFRLVPLFVAGALLPPLAFFLFFQGQMPAQDAFRSVLAASGLFVKRATADNAFYRSGMGIDTPLENLWRLASKSAAALAAVAAVYAGVRYRSRTADGWRRFVATVFVIAFPVVAWDVRLQNVGAALPALGVMAFVFLLHDHLRAAREPGDGRDRTLPLVLWGAFSVLMLAKMALNARLAFYGFCLASPSVALIAVVAVWFLPSRMEPKAAGAFRAAMLAVVLAVSAHAVSQSLRRYRAKDTAVGRGPDLIYAVRPSKDERTAPVAEALEWIESHLGPEETLVALPEGVMLNYLARRRNSTRYVNFMPPELAQFGEPEIAADLGAHPPDYFAIVHKDTSAYGVGFFGQDVEYGEEILRWVRSNYSRVALFGEEPLQDEKEFGVEILRRKAPASRREGLSGSPSGTDRGVVARAGE